MQLHHHHHRAHALRQQEEAAFDPPRLGLLEVLGNPKRFTRTRTDILFDAALRYGPVVRLPKPFDRMYLVSDPGAVKRVLVDNVSNWPKSEEYRPLAEWVGRGLITSEGEVWATDRRMLQPAFHRELLEKLSVRVRESAELLVASFSRRLREREHEHEHEQGHVDIDVADEMMQLSLVLIGHRLFGGNIGRTIAAEISALMNECQEYVTNRMLSFDFARGRFERNMRRLRALIEHLSEDADDSSIAGLLRTRAADRVSQIDQLLGFLVAGHETTAMALTWTLMLLAKHPSIQERARRGGARQEGGVFLRAVVDESMRLYPPVPCFARRAIEDDVLAGFRLRKGAKVIVAPHVTHRLPRYWDEPLLFDPDRFMPERRSAIPSNAYFPFGMGPRTCIGASMAMMECRVVLETILSRFTLEPGWGRAEPRALAMISLRPDGPVTLRVSATTATAMTS